MAELWRTTNNAFRFDPQKGLGVFHNNHHLAEYAHLPIVVDLFGDGRSEILKLTAEEARDLRDGLDRALGDLEEAKP